MTAYSNNPGKRNRFRIIAGKWRRRVLRFPGEVASLRPTTDRIRETVFNWLQPKITGARCLDPFAGSGAFAFEACSRGAASVTALDISPVVTQMLKKNCSLLECTNMDIVTADAVAWLKTPRSGRQFDIIFLDPPYDLTLLPECAGLLTAHQWLAPGSIIYLEHSSPLETLPLPATWKLLRNRRAGQVYYGVCEQVID